MPHFIVEREVGAITTDQVNAAAASSRDAGADMQGFVWVKSYVSQADGKIYCEVQAPDAETVREHSRRAGLPITRVSEVSLEICPTMFT